MIGIEICSVTFVNLTPHAINVRADGKMLEFPPSGTVARVRTIVKPNARWFLPFPIVTIEKEGTEGLPDPEKKTCFIVSAMVREANPFRMDICSPGELIRDEKGQPIGCTGLVFNS